jgi:hypothetical protein
MAPWPLPCIYATLNICLHIYTLPATHLGHRGCIGVAGRLHSRHIGEGGLVWRAGEQAEEVLEVAVAGGAPDQEDAGNLDLQPGGRADGAVMEAAQGCNTCIVDFVEVQA